VTALVVTACVTAPTLLFACGGDSTPASADAVSLAETTGVAETTATAETTTATETTAPSDVTGAREGRGFELADGRLVEGELIARYDHAQWWDEPAERLTLAVFDPDRFAAWPDDRAIVFVDQADVVSESAVVLPSDRPRYRDWLAANALGIARAPSSEPMLVVTAHEEHHRAERGYGDFAWDLVLADDSGARWRDDGDQLDDYFSWAAPVLAPVSGLVVEVVRDEPDIPPGSLPEDGLAAPENLVGIHLAGAFHVYLLHLRQGSIPSGLEPFVSTVALGDPLGEIGNSGTTLEPHLHLVMLYWDFERERFWSVPCDFFDVWVAPGPRGATHHEHHDPTRGERVSAEAF
jgi:hypothetical protein